MSYNIEFIQHYFPAIVACIAFGFFNLYNRLDARKVYRYFVLSSLSIFFLIIAEYAHGYYAALPYPTLGHTLSSVFGYILRPCIVYFAFRIPSRNWGRKECILNSIPLFVNIFVQISALFTSLVFYYDADNSFVRGPLGFTPFVVSGIYLFEIVIYGLTNLKRREGQEAVMCTAICVMCIIATALESVYEMSGILPSISIVGLIIYYMSFFVNRYSHDQLTDTYLRSRLFDHLSRLHSPSYFITIDINGLKQINDSMGHKAGDEAITALTEAIFTCLPSYGRLYRMGGDEFAVVLRTEDAEQVKTFVGTVNDLLRHRNVTFSYGYAPMKDGKNYTEASIAADEMMYRNKRQFYLDHEELNRRK